MWNSHQEYLQLFEMYESLKGILVDVLYAVAVQVQVLEPAQPVERARAQLSQPVVVEEQRAQGVQVCQHARLDVLDLIEPQVPAQSTNM